MTLKDEDESESGFHVPERGEPAGFISLASHVFIFMDKHLPQLMTLDPLKDEQMKILANIISDLDSSSSSSDNSESETIQRQQQQQNLDDLEYHLSNLYVEFSTTLATFTHNLNFRLSERLKFSLLAYLGVDIKGSKYPLQIPSRTLSVVGKVILTCESMDFTQIWNLAIDALSEEDAENEEDLNVEHAQLLLLLFHSLTLMQKKSILLKTSKSLISAQLGPKNLVKVTRLAQLFEYQLRHLYEPPKELLEQVDSNIFNQYKTAKKSNFLENHEYDQSVRYYQLWNSQYAYTELTPKLDGLAVSFLLGDHENYERIYEAFLGFMGVLDKELDDEMKKFFFRNVWRILQSLPPSKKFFGADNLKFENYDPRRNLQILCLLEKIEIHKSYIQWIKDGLIKQGLTQSKAESLIENFTNSNFSLSLLMNFFEHTQKTAGFLASAGDRIMLDLLTGRAQKLSDGEEISEILSKLLRSTADLVKKLLLSRRDSNSLKNCLAICGKKFDKTSNLSSTIRENLPEDLSKNLKDYEKIGESTLGEISTNTHAILKFHLHKENDLKSAKRLLFILAKLASAKNLNATFLTTDILADFFDLKQNSTTSTLKMYQHCLEKCYEIATATEDVVNPNILIGVAEFIGEKLFEDEVGKTALENFFECNDKLMNILFASDSFKSVEYSSAVFKLFRKLFESDERWIEVSNLARIPGKELDSWLQNLVTFDNRRLLQSLSKFVVKDEDKGEEVAVHLLKCLMPMASKILNASPAEVAQQVLYWIIHIQ